MNLLSSLLSSHFPVSLLSSLLTLWSFHFLLYLLTFSQPFFCSQGGDSFLQASLLSLSAANFSAVFSLFILLALYFTPSFLLSLLGSLVCFLAPNYLLSCSIMHFFCVPFIRSLLFCLLVALSTHSPLISLSSLSAHFLAVLFLLPIPPSFMLL